jgi:hypothetical protein
VLMMTAGWRAVRPARHSDAQRHTTAAAIQIVAVVALGGAHHSTSGPKRRPPARSTVRWVLIGEKGRC